MTEIFNFGKLNKKTQINWNDSIKQSNLLAIVLKRLPITVFTSTKFIL